MDFDGRIGEWTALGGWIFVWIVSGWVDFSGWQTKLPEVGW